MATSATVLRGEGGDMATSATVLRGVREGTWLLQLQYLEG